MSKNTIRTDTMRRPLRLVGIAALGAVAALTLSSCAGSEAPALEDVWPEVSESIENATSVAIDGSMTQDGRDLTVAISGQIDDSSYGGHIAMDGSEIDVVGNKEFTYMKPNAAFYEELGGAQLQDMVGDQWLEMPAEQGGFTMSSLWDSFTGEIPSADDFGESEYTAEVVDLNDEEVYKYTSTSEDSDEPVSVYISQDHQLMRVEAQGGTSDEASASPSASPDDTSTGTGTMDFSQWDAVDPVDMPADEEIFEIPGM